MIEWYFIVIITILVYNTIGFILALTTHENKDVVYLYACGVFYPICKLFYYLCVKLPRKIKERRKNDKRSTANNL